MNVVDIAIFKHYIKERGIRKQFIISYRRSLQMSGNPQSIEDYLSNVEPLVVITKAIRTFNINSPFGYDFWQDVIADWKDNYERVIKKGGPVKSEKGLAELEGYFKVLRENWDSSEPGAWEEIPVAQKRYGLKPVVEDIVEDTASKEEEKSELDFIDLDTKKASSTRLKENEASVNFRNKSYRVLLSQEISMLIRENAFFYSRIATNKNGDMIIQFNRESKGVKVANSIDTRNISVNSKVLATHIREHFNLTEDYFVINLEQLSKADNFINYKITLR